MLCSFISLLAFTQSIDSVIYHPYRINGNLLTQTEALNIGNSETVLVDKQYKESVVAIDSLLKSATYTNNDYLFYYSNIIGLTYLLKHRLPKADNDWFAPQNIDYNCNVLSQLYQSEPTAKLFFILDGKDSNSESLINYWTQIRYGANTYHKSADINVDFSNTVHFLSIYTPE